MSSCKEQVLDLKGPTRRGIIKITDAVGSLLGVPLDGIEQFLAEKGAGVSCVQRVVAKRLRTQLQRQLSSLVIGGKDRRAGFGTTCIYVDKAK